MPGTELTLDKPTAEGRKALRAAAALYIKHLESLAVEAKKLGKDRESAVMQREADTLKVDLLGPDEDPALGALSSVHEAVVVTAPQTKAIGKGLEFYLKNLRAAKGTLRGLGEDDLAEEFEEKAKRVEAHLVPLFQEQQALALTSAAPETEGEDAAPPKASDVRNLRELADEEAEREERKGALPIGMARKSGAKAGR